MSRPETLSRAQARRVALAAQGFCDPPHTVPTLRTLQRTVERTGVLQVDSVNVLQRAHYMPLYARMGPYETSLLPRAAERPPRRLVEYWAHVQALMPVELWPVMAHRMADYRERRGKWGGGDDPALAARLLAEVTARGASTARDLDDGAPKESGHWGWNWSQARRGLDYLYSSGQLAIAGRTRSFEVVYDLPERVLPAAVLAQPTPTRVEADVELVRRAAASHGVASVRCLADYYRMGTRPTAAAVEVLVETGELTPVRVEGWARPAYLHHAARLPRRVPARTVLSPFDPVVWLRERTEALFDFHYRIEIYVPAHRRVHGYYVLPFLLGDRLVARVDLKADRTTGLLLVPGAFAEPTATETSPGESVLHLAAELRRLAGWLGLHDVVVGDRGDLAAPLAVALRAGAQTLPPP
ncbi:winged helix-turn-helix domain-containing protein [Nocardioides nanhaiensis]|uniref:Winged helix-turn-helix domain-containing protein n=1 Tax=Nocardioides nanhaiensis TaxID=1476871 RepID=A0ABP8W216_9ACTN